MTKHSTSTSWFAVGAIALCLSACGQVQTSKAIAPTPSVAPTLSATPTPSINISVSRAASPEPSTPPLTLASEPKLCNQPQTQAEMTYCAGQTAKQEDDELNSVYQELRKELDGTDREERLIDAQLAWISFRDADCAYVASQFEGGSQQPQVTNDCIARLTRQRTTQLKEYLNWAKQ
jgi:uncharacterized protein YecT (DUF1311 family)